MAKRRSNVSVSQTNTSDSEASYSDFENDRTYEPVNKKKRITMQPTLTEEELTDQRGCPNEDNEHTYSTTPIFNYLPAATKKSNNYSSDSDYENYQRRSARGVKRSTSESSRSEEKGKRISSTFPIKRQPKCFSRNAVMARVNRQKKKEYVEKLEAEINELKEDNTNLKSLLDDQKEVLKNLSKQIQYLRSALLNSKDIGLLLRKIQGDKADLNVTSSLLNTPQSESPFNLPDINFNEDENKFDWSGLPAVDSMIDTDIFGLDEAPSSGIADIEPLQQFGVCLHVSSNQVSVEFCDVCCNSASKGAFKEESNSMVK